jgi:hypothetical protein
VIDAPPAKRLATCPAFAAQLEKCAFVTTKKLGRGASSEEPARPEDFHQEFILDRRASVEKVSDLPGICRLTGKCTFVTTKKFRPEGLV